MTVQQLYDEFIFTKRVSGINQNSIRTYQATVGFLVRHIGPETPLEGITYETATGYVLEIYKRPISRSTMSSYVRDTRIFLRWVHTEYGLPFDPARIKVPKSPKKIVHIYSDDEIRQIFSLIQTSEPWITARNRALVALMLDSGLRQCEACGLLHGDIDRSRMVMKVTGKGAKDRMVPLGRFALSQLDAYLELCPWPASGPVFLDRRGNPLSGNAVRLFVNRLEKQLPFRLSSHRLRHNFATNYCIDHVRQTGKSDVYDLSILMGHESIETTKKYEHFAHEIIAAENSISHLDACFGAPDRP